jgi:hypothetical protein
MHLVIEPYQYLVSLRYPDKVCLPDRQWLMEVLSPRSDHVGRVSFMTEAGKAT